MQRLIRGAAARRARSLVVAAALRLPGLIRGHTLSAAVSRELQRRLDRSVSSGRSISIWAHVLRSRNITALRSASSAAVRAAHPTPLIAAIERRSMQRPDDVTLRLDRAAVLRRAGESTSSATALAAIGEVALGDVRPLLREALELGDPKQALTVLRGATPRDEQTRDRLRGAVTLVEQMTDADVADVASEWRQDAAVLAAAGVAASAQGYGTMGALAEVLLDGSAADAATVAGLAVPLREAGDLTLSTALAKKVLTVRNGDVMMRRLATVGQAELRTLERGWAAPAASPTAQPPVASRIHYLLHSSLPYTSLGYAVRTQGLLSALGGQGWDVRGVTRPGYPEESSRAIPTREVVQGVPYQRLPLEGSVPHWPVETMVEAYLKRLEPLVRMERPGIIHAASNYRNGLAAIAAARRAGLPSVYEVRGLWQYTRLVRDPDFESTEMFALLERLEIEAARTADRTLVITRALGDHLVDRGVPEEQILVAPNGVDTRRFVPRGRDHDLAMRLGVEDRTVIGYVGGIVEYEGLGLMIEAAARLATRRDDFAILVVGDGRSLPGLLASVHEAGLDRIVTFTGRVPHEDVERYYSLVDIAPFPRLPEKVCELVSPLKPFEAMAAGKAVVASDVAALAEIVDDGRTGLLFEKGSASALAATLDRLLDDAPLRKRLADEGLSWVRRERDWATLAQIVSDVWDDLWLRHHGSRPQRSFQRSIT